MRRSYKRGGDLARMRGILNQMGREYIRGTSKDICAGKEPDTNLGLAILLAMAYDFDIKMLKHEREQVIKLNSGVVEGIYKE